MIDRSQTNPSCQLMIILALAPFGMLFGCSGSGNGNGNGGTPHATGGRTSTGGMISTGGAASGSGGNGSGGTGTAGAPVATGGGGGRGNATGGSAEGGNATGGISTGGGPTGGSATGGTTNSGGAGSGGAGTGGSGAGGIGTAIPGITKDREGQVALSGLTLVSYGGYLNGESFQQDGIVSTGGYQYAALWNTNRHVVMARRSLPDGVWSKFEFTDYTNSADDAHNTISLGISPGDGTLHLSFDHHVNNLHYRKSVAGLLTTPATAIWAASSFSAVTDTLVGTTAVTQVTYPRFVTEPGGKKMLFGARFGTSGSGDEYLWEYDTTTRSWISLGKYLDGITDNINAYPHGLSYTKGGTRLHASWCWRDTPDASSNHDLFYAYSDDHGRTWKNNAGVTIATTGTSFVNRNSPGAKVWTINQNRGLINQEHMAVDPAGRVHVLLSHMPDAQPDDATFDSARTKSQFFHYWRNPSGLWTRTALGLPVVANFRGKLAISSTNNVYAILPDLRIAAASASSNFASWSLLDSSDSGRFFSDPLIDTDRLDTEDKLTVYYPQKSSVNIWALDYTIR
jgi:BNR repeat-containing family member